MKTFLLLNGVGVIFLLYVLVQFWKEGRRSKGAVPRRHALEVPYQGRTKVVVVMRPIYNRAQPGRAVVPFQALGRGLKDQHGHREASVRISELPIKGNFAR